jgi:hypothetical protein
MWQTFYFFYANVLYSNLLYIHCIYVVVVQYTLHYCGVDTHQHMQYLCYNNCRFLVTFQRYIIAVSLFREWLVYNTR